jgi:hypothetical protein
VYCLPYITPGRPDRKPGFPTVGCYGNQQYRSGERIHGNIQLRLHSNGDLQSNTSQYIQWNYTPPQKDYCPINLVYLSINFLLQCTPTMEALESSDIPFYFNKSCFYFISGICLPFIRNIFRYFLSTTVSPQATGRSTKRIGRCNIARYIFCEKKFICV